MTSQPRRQRRIRPRFATTLHPDVARALRERAEKDGVPVSHVTEDLLRASLGMPLVANTTGSERSERPTRRRAA